MGKTGLEILLLAGWLASAANAGWEYGPISRNTRLPAGDSEVWEFGMVYTAAALYPDQIICPAGSRLVIHFLNLSPEAVTLEVEGTAAARVAPGAYRRLRLGTQAPGTRTLVLENVSAEDNAHAEDPRELPAQMKIPLLAGTWPGETAVYRAVWLRRGPSLLPRRSLLPAGRVSELFLAASPGTSSRLWEADSHTFLWKPGQVTLTEFIRPASAVLPCPPAENPPGQLLIR